MIKERFLAVLLFFLFLFGSLQLQAQVEVVPLEEGVKEFYFDSIRPGAELNYVERKVPDSIIQKLKMDEAFWYVNGPVQKKAEQKREKEVSINWLKERWVRTTLWFLIIGLFAAVLVWYLSTLNIRLFRKSSAIIESSNDMSVAEDIFSIPYASQINSAIQAANYRQAVRLYYLQTLSLLSNKGLIQYQQDSTNSAYVMELFKTHYYKDFFQLTRSFEYTWYGKFELTAPQFGVLQKDFEIFYSQLPA